MNELPKFTMEFEPTTIEHLGLKLYVSLPPVIGELVSNAWDADAHTVEVTLPMGGIDEKSEVIVRDYGSEGMDAEALQKAYLPIGRNRRDAMQTDTTKKGRPVMGRKGIGKLSAFGVASEVEILTINKGQAICLRLNYDDMKSWPPGKPYEPKIVSERCGHTKDTEGTEIRLRKFHRRRPINEDWVRRELARRFTVVGDEFKVLVNGKQISPEDRRLREECKRFWDVKDLPGKGVIDEAEGWNIQGWIGIVERSSQTERGVDIFARGKAVELESTFRLKTTHIQFARAYVVGEVHADFLDAEEDNISTGRNAALWESAPGQKLEEWGQEALVFVFREWLELQRKEKEDRIITTAGFDKWLSTRTPREQKVASKLVKTIVDDQNIEPESAGPLLEIIKTNVEFQAFQELVDEIEGSEISVETLLKLFKDWRVIEAREHLKLSDGRLEVMEKLSEFIKKGALEVKHIQPLFEENGWLVEPAWGEVSGQTRYTELLREHCKEPKSLDEKDRRIDILGYSVNGVLHVVELKRPDKTLSRNDLEQIEKYVDFARSKLVSTGEGSPNYIRGLLIVGRLNSDSQIQRKMQRLAGDDIRVDTFDGLLERAERIYGQVEKVLKKIAPEYSREARRARKAN
ncbi:MAG: ATP-binding protein [Candidatus Binatia bacterium]